MMKRFLTVAALTSTLIACEGGELVRELTTQLGAANGHPCEADFDYQFELNGAATDTHTSSAGVDGEVIITEQHWYSEMQMIVFYSYQQDADWCNMWNESGVEWNF